MKNVGTDMTKGSIKNHIIKFSTPLFIGNVLQISYSMINRVWAGKFLGKDALGAISISSLISFIMLAFALGMTMSTNILVAQYYGAKNDSKLKKTVSNSFIIVGIISIITTILVIVFAKDLLILINTPKDIMDMSLHYLIILSFGTIFVFGFNLISSIFRGLGDSISPLKFLGISLIINTILDPFLMLGIGPFPKMGVNGASLALVISQGIAFIWGMVYLQKHGGIAKLDFKNLQIDKFIIRKILRLGLPASGQQLLISSGIAVIQSLINSFGNDAIASYAATSNIDNLVFQPAMSVGAAISAMVGQNLGANKMDRVNNTLKYGLAFCTIITSVVAICCLLIPKILLMAFVKSEDVEVLVIGVQYLRIVGISYIFICNMVVINGVFNGAGDTLAAMVISVFNLWILRVPLAEIFSKHLGIDGVWIGIAVSFTISFFLALAYYKLGFWRKKAKIMMLKEKVA